MKILKLFYSGILIICISINAISQGWESSNSILSTINIEAESSILNSANSFIVSGTFEGTTNLQGVDYVANSKDIFVCKYDENYNLEWFNQIGGNNLQFYPRLTFDNNENITLVGAFWETIYFTEDDSLVSDGFADIFLAKYDDTGNLLSEQKLAGGPTPQVTSAIATDNDGNFIIAGYYRDSIEFSNGTKLFGNPGIFTSFVLKTDGSGNHIWSKNLIGTNSENLISNISVFDEGYYFNGKYKGSLQFDVETLNNPKSVTDIFVYKTDNDGQGQWVRTCSGNGNDASGTITEDLYGNIYLTGFFFSNSLSVDSTENQVSTVPLKNGGNSDIFIIKYNKNGILQWAKSYGSTGYDWAINTIQRNNFLYVTGYFSDKIYFEEDTLISSSVNDYDFLYAGFDIEGNLIEASSFNSSNDGNDVGATMKVNENNDVYIAGYFRSTSITIGDSTYISLNPGERELFTAQYKPQFNIVFSDKNDISCYGFSDGELTVTSYFGVPPYTYTWTKDGSPISETNAIATGLDAGLYRVTVTDSRDSVATRQIQLNNPAPISIAYATDEVSCYNGNDGGIDITASGGNNNYTYNWAGGTGLSPTLEDQTGLIAADYTVTVTDSKGCTGSQTITLGQADPIIFGESLVTSTNADVDTGRVDLVLNGGTEPFTDFLWEGPDGYSSIESSIDSLNGGNYSITVTDANSCIADTIFLVPNDSIFIGYMTAVNNVTCGDLTDGSAVVTSNRYDDEGPETHTDFEYLWIDMEDSTHIGGNFPYISNLDSSNYRVYIVDGIKGDSTFVNFKITKPELLSVNSIPSNPTCFGGSNGSVNAVTTGGTLPYSYEWSNSATVEDLAAVQAGTYTLTVTDANSCTATTEETLENPEAIAITFDISNPLCPNTLTGSATANVTGGGLIYDYAWSDPGNQSTQTATGLGQGTYTVTVTDQNSCVETDAVTLNDPLAVSVTSVDSEDATCFGVSDGWIKVTAAGGSGNYTYDWSHMGLGTDSVGDLGAGTYTVTVNDVNDCTPVIETIIISEPTEIIVDIDTVDNVCFCDGNGQITVTPSGGSGSFDYSWGHTSDNTGTLTNLLAGNYNLTLSDGACPDRIYDIPVGEPSEIVVSIDTTDISCLNAGDGEIAITTTGGTEDFTYAWSHDATTEGTIAVTEPGTYTVTISDGACPDIVYNIPVTEPDLFEVDIDTTVTNCFSVAGGTITVTPTGGSENYSYTWSHTTDNVNQVTDLTYGSYDVTISDGSCPDITANVFVDQPDPLVFDIDTTNISCLGYSDGAISVDVTGGSGTYTYTWGHTSSNVSALGGLSEGTYNLTISDGACPDSALAIPVAEPEEFLVSIDKEDLSCYNSGDGSVQVTISGGSENYDITWGHTTEKLASITNLEAGSYDVTVDDGNCPVISESVELTEPEVLLIVGYDSVNLSSAGAHDGQIIIHVTGGTKPYRYSINPLEPSQEDSVFNNLDAGKYKVVINDVNNCGPVATDSIELEALVGIQNYWEESSITYYPNPADENVTIEIKDLNSNVINLKVVNSMGSLLISKEVEIPNRQNRIDLNTDQLTQGIYFILIDNIRLKTPLVIK